MDFHLPRIYYWYYKSSFITVGKNLLQGRESFSLSQPIWLWKVKVCYLVTIISLWHSSVKLYQSSNLIGSLLIAKIGVFSSIHTSVAKSFLGANRWTVWPSSNNKKLLHVVNSLVHLKSFRKMVSALSVATQLCVSLAGVGNVENIFSSGFSRNLLP